MEYENIAIRIFLEKSSEKNYQVFLSSQKDSSKFASTEFSFPEREWKEFETLLARVYLRRGVYQDTQVISVMGKKLFQALFSSNATSHEFSSRDFYRDLKKDCAERRVGIRLQLYIGPSELIQLPWELMCEEDSQYLGLNNNPKISIVRATPKRERSINITENRPPVRFLGMIAKQYSPYDKSLALAQEERSKIEETFRPLRERELVEIEWVEPNVDALERRLKEKAWHIFHFIGHSGYDHESGQGYIVLADKTSGSHKLMADQLATLLSGKGLMLVVLNSCEGGRGSEDDKLSSLAFRLAAKDIPAILAMQYNLPEEMGPRFAERFYRELVQSSWIDDAVVEARHGIYRGSNISLLDWSMLVFYMSSQNGVAFNFEASPMTIPVTTTTVSQVSQLPGGKGHTSIPAGDLQATSPALPFPRSSLPSRKKRPVVRLVRILLALLIVVGAVFAIDVLPLSFNPIYNCNDSSIQQYYDKASANETPPSLDFLVLPVAGWHDPFQCSLIGLSSGAFVFDTSSQSADKLWQAAKAYRSSDQSNRATYLEEAINNDPQNAEARIYEEDRRVLSSNSNYNIVIVGDTLQSDNLGGARDILQGTYLAQTKYNQQKGQVPIVVLIANSGSNPNNATAVAQGIVAFAKKHPNLIGVMGWPLSSHTLNAIGSLTTNKISLVSPTSSTNDIVPNPFFFRVVSSDQLQSIAATQYIHDRLAITNSAYKVAVFYDQGDNYSNDLSIKIRNQLNALSIQSEMKGYNANCPWLSNGCQTLDKVLRTTLQEEPQPDLIYMASYTKNAQNLLKMMEEQHAPANIKVMGGDALAVLNNYPAGQLGLERLIVTAFASQDEAHHNQSDWQNFVSEYITTFTPKDSFIDSDVILAYDAMEVLLQGYQKKFAGDKSCLLSCQVANGLANLGTYQGLSGEITFSSGNSDPLKKTIVIAHIEVGNNGSKRLHTDQVQICSSSSGSCNVASST